jgi:site-specific recombinase XerD
MKLRDAVKLFLGEYKPGTRRSYGDDLNIFMQYVAPSLDVKDITMPEVIRAIQLYEQRETVKSVYTVNKHIRTVRRFFNWCVQLELIEKSPARKILKRPEPNNDVLERTMPEDVYFGLINHYTDAAKIDPKRYTRFLALLHFLGTSSRRGGAAGLRWDDIDFATREVLVIEKGEKTRTLFLDDDTINVLRRWQLIQKASQGDYVFSLKGSAITPSALGKFFRDYCHKAGYDKPGCKNGWGIHSVRHYVGIDLQDAGVGEIEASGIMGHTVQTYRNFYASQDKGRLKAAALATAQKRRVNRKKIVPHIDFLKRDDETG